MQSKVDDVVNVALFTIPDKKEWAVLLFEDGELRRDRARFSDSLNTCSTLRPKMEEELVVQTMHALLERIRRHKVRDRNSRNGGP